MATRQSINREHDVLLKWHAAVAAAAAAFESRWMLRTLCGVDATLYLKMREQRDLFDAALVTGTADDIEMHGAAMCRGYAVAAGALESAGAPDDAYLLGSDPATGLRVAIGVQRAAATRVAELYGDGVIWMSPDEVAALMSASADAAHFAGTVKRLWPGAVVS